MNPADERSRKIAQMKTMKMKKHLTEEIVRIVFVLVFTLLFLSCGDSKTDASSVRPTAGSQQPKGVATVIAEEGLVLRAEPGTSALKIDVVPFGALIGLIDKEGPRDKIDGVEDRWVKAVYEGKQGWCFGAFLLTGDFRDATRVKKETAQALRSKYKLMAASELVFGPVPGKINASTLHYKYFHERCASEMCRTSITLQLAGGAVHFKEVSICGYGDSTTDEDGRYTVLDSRIMFVLKPGTKTVRDSDSSQVPSASEGRTLVLYYIPALDGFVEEKDLNFLKTIKFIINVNEKYFASFEDELNYRLCRKECALAIAYRLVGFYTFQP
jgi:hypothetical protein